MSTSAEPTLKETKNTRAPANTSTFTPSGNGAAGVIRRVTGRIVPSWTMFTDSISGGGQRKNPLFTVAIRSPAWICATAAGELRPTERTTPSRFTVSPSSRGGSRASLDRGSPPRPSTDRSAARPAPERRSRSRAWYYAVLPCHSPRREGRSARCQGKRCREGIAQRPSRFPANVVIVAAVPGPTRRHGALDVSNLMLPVAVPAPPLRHGYCAPTGAAPRGFADVVSSTR